MVGVELNTGIYATKHVATIHYRRKTGLQDAIKTGYAEIDEMGCFVAYLVFYCIGYFETEHDFYICLLMC